MGIVSFGKRFKQLRKEYGLTQQELADDFNKVYGYTFAKSSISQYENGKRVPENPAVINFAQYFNVSIDYLVGVSDIRNTIQNAENPILNKVSLQGIYDFFKDENIARKEKDELYKAITDSYLNAIIR